MARFSEHLIMEGFDYSFGLAVGDINDDGSLDITAADADGRALYWFQNDGKLGPRQSGPDSRYRRRRPPGHPSLGRAGHK